MDTEDIERLPVMLVDLLANSVILRQTAPYIPVKSLLALSATCKTLHDIINTQSDAWRYLDLTRICAAQIDSTPIDVGGLSWQAERMDESLTEDEFYAGPLRGIFGRLRQKQILQHVQTLVLDGLSVPADLVGEIVSEDRYNVRVLSIREAKHLNQSKVQQVLNYIVRPTRAGGSPKLKALYFFGPKDAARSIIGQSQQVEGSQPLGVMASEAAQIGAAWNQWSSTVFTNALGDEETKWYCATGRALKQPMSGWADTLQVCKGVIAFDAVLCRGPRHDITKVESKDFLQPSIASIALGPGGCEICHSCPEGTAVFGEATEADLPLLGPPPSHASTVRASQLPYFRDANGGYPKLILRCSDCLRGRWCERCGRWWCEDCYKPVSRLNMGTELQEYVSRIYLGLDGWLGASADRGRGTPVKVYARLCVEHCLVRRDVDVK